MPSACFWARRAQYEACPLLGLACLVLRAAGPELKPVKLEPDSSRPAASTSLSPLTGVAGAYQWLGVNLIGAASLALVCVFF